MSVKNLVFVDNSTPQCDAEWLNSVRSEVNNFVTNSGQTPSVANLDQLGIASSIYSAGADFYTDSGAADAYVLSSVGSKSAPDAYFTGMQIRFIVGNTNTGASTVNVATLGVKNIKARDASSDPSAGDLVAGQIVTAAYDGTNFVISSGVAYAASIFPVGAMIDYAGTSAPSGWLLCYGQAVSRTTYANLFSQIGTAFGTGDGSTTFNLPDKRGRVSIGLDNLGGSSANRITSANADSLNNTGAGSETTTATGSVGTSGSTTLTTSQIPSQTLEIGITATASGTTIMSAGTAWAESANASAGGQMGDTAAVSTWRQQNYIRDNNSGSSHSHSGGSFSGNAVTSTQPWIALGAIIKF